jgi:tetratricopeptide (TPR) repeat protein
MSFELNRNGFTNACHSGLISRPSVHILLIAFLALFIYINTLDSPFHFDDKSNIVENPIIKDLRYFIDPSEAVQFMGLGTHSAFKRRYIGHLSFALNYRFHGLDTRGYHLTNLAVHIINGVLLYLLVILTFRTPWMAGSALQRRANLIGLFSALLFVCHPVQTQAVTYIVQRLSSMATMFYLASVVLFVGSRLTDRRAARWGMYVLSIISALLAMKTKESAFTLPLAIAIYEFMFFVGKRKRRLLYLVPILMTMIVIPISIISLVALDRPATEILGSIDALTKSQTQDMSRLEYLSTQVRVTVTYIRLLFLPMNQNLDYDYPAYGSIANPGVFVSLLFLVSVFGPGIYLLLKSNRVVAGRLAAFGVIWFFLALSVESSLIPLHAINEHRMYLPSAGAFVALVTGVFMVVAVTEKRKMLRVLAALAIGFVVMFSTAALARNSVWQSDIALWSDTAGKSPGKSRSFVNLGFAYEEQLLYDKAVTAYRAALEYSPNNASIHNNLGVVYDRLGLYVKAIGEYRAALKIDPGDTSIYNNLGATYSIIGEYDNALMQFRTALKYRYDDAETHNNLGIMYKRLGQYDNAVGEFREALRFNRDYVEAHNNLGVVYKTLGRYEKALVEYAAALEIDPDYAEAYNNRGAVYMKKKMYGDAETEFRKALSLDPGNPTIANNLNLAQKMIRKDIQVP